MATQKHILFLCVANSARSQLAEGLARHLFGAEAEIQSAGSAPSQVNPFTTRVLHELGIDSSNHSSKLASELPPVFLSKVDYVITLCSEEVCPVFLSNAPRLHWPLSDPAIPGATEEELLQGFRATRDEISQRLREFREKIKDESATS